MAGNTVGQIVEPVNRDEQTAIRDRLFKELTEIGSEKGFSQVEMTQTTTSQNGERMEWSIRVVFTKGVRFESH